MAYPEGRDTGGTEWSVTLLGKISSVAKFKNYSLPKKSKNDITKQQWPQVTTIAYTTASITPESWLQREQKLINAALVAMPTIYNNEARIRK